MTVTRLKTLSNLVVNLSWFPYLYFAHTSFLYSVEQFTNIFKKLPKQAQIFNMYQLSTKYLPKIVKGYQISRQIAQII